MDHEFNSGRYHQIVQLFHEYVITLNEANYYIMKLNQEENENFELMELTNA